MSILLISARESNIVSKLKECGDYPFDESNLGEIKEYFLILPSVIGEKVGMFNNQSKQYAVLEKYTEDYHKIEIIKRIYNINRRKFHLCTYKNNPCFLFQIDPDEEQTILISKIKKKDITVTLRLNLILLVICGVVAKIWSKDDVFYTRKIKNYDYTKVLWSDAKTKKFFDTRIEIDEILDVFKDDIKLKKVKKLLGYSWFDSFEQRLLSF